MQMRLIYYINIHFIDVFDINLMNNTLQQNGGWILYYEYNLHTFVACNFYFYFQLPKITTRLISHRFRCVSFDLREIRENEEKGIVLGRSDELLYIARLHSAESENYVLEWSRCRGTRFMKLVMQPVIQGIYIFIPLEITGCCFHETVIIPVQ